MQRQIALSDALHLLLGAAYLAYLSLRAFLIPATVDEAFSVLYYVPREVWRIVTYTYAEPSANNHILNTLCIKLLTSVFGMNLFSSRFANLLAGGLYVGAGIWLVKTLFGSGWARAAGLILWLCNPYMAEFFSIGRGYGLSIGLMALATCLAYRFLQAERPKHLAGAMAAAWLGVAASFTLLSFYLCLSAIVFLKLLRKTPALRKQWAIFATAHVSLALLLYLPITRMMAFKEFEKFGVTGFFKDTVQDFIRTFFYGKEFLGEWHFETTQWLLVGWTVLATLLFLYKWWAAKTLSPQLLALALLPGTLAVYGCMTTLTDAAWLPARSCQFLFPLLVLSFLGVGQWLVQAVGAWLKPPLLLLAFLSAICFTRVANLRQSFEWWFDRDTFVILDLMKNHYLENQCQTPVRFNTYWLFSLSFKYHLLANNGEYARYVDAELPWRDAPLPEDDYTFFYFDARRVGEVTHKYDPIWVLEPGQRVLVKRKAEKSVEPKK